MLRMKVRSLSVGAADHVGNSKPWSEALPPPGARAGILACPEFLEVGGIPPQEE